MSQVASAMPRAVRDLDADTRGRAIDSLRASMADHQTARGVVRLGGLADCGRGTADLAERAGFSDIRRR
jgi:hypothetical protein